MPKDLYARLKRLLNQNPDFFDSSRPLSIGFAPGRLDVMGGIADYSGSLVLEMPIADKTWVVVQPRTDNTLLFYSENGSRQADCLLEDVLPSPETARNYFKSNSSDHWASYLAGMIPVLNKAGHHIAKHGFSAFVYSTVPEGKGVSSSAALESAALLAYCEAETIALDREALPLLCQKVENLVAGAPCGIMDQATSLRGHPNALLPIRCQPCQLYEPLPLPDNLDIWAIDSGIRHAVTGSSYQVVRTAAFMGYRIIADEAGLETERLDETGRVHIQDPNWGGYLANISPALFEERFAGVIPDSMKGADFLDRYQGVSDPLSTVIPDKDYPVLAATAHPVYEQARTQEFLDRLQKGPDKQDLFRMGDLMKASHDSYSACGLGTEGTDRIVDLVLREQEKGLYGAKISGGGSGGAVVVLAERHKNDIADEIITRYQDSTGHRAAWIAGRSTVEEAQPAQAYSLTLPA
jgi:L-arabinokinase